MLRLLYALFITLKFGLIPICAPSKNPIGSFILNTLAFSTRTYTQGERVRISLERLGPIFVKFGQILSTRRDIVSADIIDELVKLQDHTLPIDFPVIKDIIETSLQKPLSCLFSDFSELPVASASIAQVHFATLMDGTPVAVKVLRPNIANAVQRDIALLYRLARIANYLLADVKHMRPHELIAEFSKHTMLELDLMLEAAHCSEISDYYPDNTVLIPKLYWNYCHSNVLVMQRMTGIPVSDKHALTMQGINLTRLAHDGVEILFRQMFERPLFHADLHPGNIQISLSGHYILLDFGIIGHLSDDDKYYLARNFLGIFERDYYEVALAHIEAGWLPNDTHIHEFQAAIRSVYEPIFNKTLQEISLANVLLALLKIARKFGIVVQPQLIMLQKNLLHIESLVRHLDPTVDIWYRAQPVLKQWMRQQLGWQHSIKTAYKEFHAWSRYLARQATNKELLNKNKYETLEKAVEECANKLNQLKTKLYHYLLFITTLSLIVLIVVIFKL